MPSHLGHLLPILSFPIRSGSRVANTSLSDSFEKKKKHKKTDGDRCADDRIVDWFSPTESSVINDPNGHLLFGPVSSLIPIINGRLHDVSITVSPFV